MFCYVSVSTLCLLPQGSFRMFLLHAEQLPSKASFGIKKNSFVQQIVVKQKEAEQAQQKIVLDFFFEKCIVELHAGLSAF